MVTFRAGVIERHRDTLLTLTTPPVGPGEFLQWRPNPPMVVLPTPPTHLGGVSAIIDLEYRLCVSKSTGLKPILIWEYESDFN